MCAAIVFVCAPAMSCGQGRSPVSPSSLTPLTALSSSLRFRPLNDEHPAPDPEPVPTPDPRPVPVTRTISIVGSFGNNAFTPNPIQASVGDMIVWTNSDQTRHRIVLDDGTVIGDVAPGESSAPMTLISPTATYRCTIHPTMVGSINGAAAPEPPTSPSPSPPDDDDDYYRYRR